ncbi:uncharacterized protein LOC143292668 isoform X2 [Babylonia areolata]|uniref:uncharacterized protein LOC143292668 isoform X2 n=1 Tax=Babylonia areolata TaxID=304850 RepID=UPI003FCF2BD6
MNACVVSTESSVVNRNFLRKVDHELTLFFPDSTDTSMNVARKSTTKLPQKWTQGQKLESREEEPDSNVASSADSTDSFQDALLNLKALSGSGDMADSDRSEVKEAQSTSGAQRVQNGVSHSEALQSKEDRDIIEQIDDIVNETPTSGVKGEQGSEEDDDILIIKDEESKEKGKQSNGIGESKVKNVPTKNPLRIGDKVRSTVHSIMSKLVQSNPDVNNLLSKAKSDSDFADSGDSRGASPALQRQDKGNLFDNFDVSEKDDKSSLNVDNSKSPEKPGLNKEDEEVVGNAALEVREDSENGQGKGAGAQTELDSASKERTVDGCVEGSASLENSRKDSASVESGVNDSNNVERDPSETAGTLETDIKEKVTLPQSSQAVDGCDDKKDKDECSVEDKTSVKCEDKTVSSCSSAEPSEGKNESDVSKSEPVETSDSPEFCDKVSGKMSESDSVCDSKLETDRKRPLEDDSSETDDSQFPKRSRLAEVIGKLGERVTFPSDMPGVDGYEYEDSTLGDTDSIEKQSEEISGSTSDEEDDKSASDSKSKNIILTKQELETLITTAAKKAIEQYQSPEILTLSRRVEELNKSQEEWRQKAKNLERQVLDLTVLQQRLEKRKAHTAALKSITTRSIGIWVTEDKFKSITPQKHPGIRTPPATPPVTTQGQPAWGSNSQPSVRSLISEASASAASNGLVTLNAASRNTSVAHLLSQTARMPTVASCTAATNRTTAAGRTITTGPRLPGSSASLAGSMSATPLPPSSANPANSLVFVSNVPAMPLANKTVSTPQAGAATVVSPAGSAQVKVIDLTMEDDPGASKQMVAPGGGRAVVPQQVVRQITPMSQGLPGVPSSAILLSSSAGTQIVNAANIQRPGMLQVVTIANPQSLRTGPIFTVVPGQNNSLVRAPATASTLTTSARDSAPLVMTQQLPGYVRQTTTGLGSGASVRPSLTTHAAGASSVASSARTPVALSTAQPAAAAASRLVQPDSGSQPASAKKNVHPAPLPDSITPKGLPADLKPPPPCPGLKISRVKQGIVLSWNMSIPHDCVEIASYQLFAYQETSAAPQTSLWKKVGDVKALPLPMACTLTQFQDGNKYHFAVRAIDVHGRSGSFSDPSFIFLTKAA